MTKVVVYIDNTSGRIEVYGSVKALIEYEGLDITPTTIYRWLKAGNDHTTKKHFTICRTALIRKPQS